mmetsp:Transcript_38672/g.93892  ORF Transcript_38672/g.93892 Transcript_38672/m.93892 type:complete len:408 (+) Transcript_38672:174-1397(+)
MVQVQNFNASLFIVLSTRARMASILQTRRDVPPHELSLCHPRKDAQRQYATRHSRWISEGTREECHVRGRPSRMEAHAPFRSRLLCDGVAPNRRLRLSLDLLLDLRVVMPRHQEEARGGGAVRVGESLHHLGIALHLLRSRLQPLLRRREQRRLNEVELGGDGSAEPLACLQLELLSIAARTACAQHAAGRHVAWACLDADGHAFALPLVELVSRPQVEARVHLHADARLLHAGGGAHHEVHKRAVPLRVFLRPLGGDGDDHHLHWREGRRQDEPQVVRVRHHQRADQPCAHAPRRRPHQLLLVLLRLELHVERLGEVLPQEVRGAGLQRPAVLHERLDRERLLRPCEALRRRLHALDDGHGEQLAAQVGVHVEHLPRAAERLLTTRVSGVSLLPQELRGAKEGPCA